MVMPTLTVIGAGKLGSTLATLWQQAGYFKIQQLCCRSLDSALDAQLRVGSGEAVSDWQDLHSADYWLLSTPDGELARTAQQLAQSGLIQPGNVVFHCSGALPSRILKPLNQLAADTASVHPVHSFADPDRSIEHFSGSCAAAEGDSQALSKLKPAFDAIGAQWLTLNSEQKPLYHAGSVMACNYLVTLLQHSLNLLQASGLSAAQAGKLLQPIVHQTVDNTFTLGAADALTGPIARGDLSTIANQIEALNCHPEAKACYRLLGQQTVSVAEQQQRLPRETLDQLRQLLKTTDAR